jgi:hypothetical protein
VAATNVASAIAYAAVFARGGWAARGRTATTR